MAGEELNLSSIAVTVVFSAGPRSVMELAMRVPPGCMASQSLAKAALAWGMASATLQCLHLGVWGKPVSAQYPLQADDRLEIYRPLTVDPKVARRERFVRQGSKGAGLFAKRRAGGKAGY